MPSVTSVPSVDSRPDPRWELRGRFPEGDLANAPYPPLIRHLLYHRGIRTPEQAAAYFDPTPIEHDALLLPDIEPALARIRGAIERGETTAIYGDFDVDGVTASAILIESLRELGAKAESYLPDRFSEGYGVNNEAIDILARARRRPDRSPPTAAPVRSMRSRTRRTLGVDTIILDHHTVPRLSPLPSPWSIRSVLDSRYGEPELASGGLAFKLMSALYASLGRQYPGERYLDLVALSTVCDVAPLRGENRSLVKRGLAALSRGERPGVRALLEVSGVDPARVDADTIGYDAGPAPERGRPARPRAPLARPSDGDVTATAPSSAPSS